MNRRLFVALAIALVACQAVAQDKAGKKGVVAPAGSGALKTNTDKVSYSIGLDIGNDLKKSRIHVEISALAAGIRDALSGAKPLLDQDEIKAAMMEMQKGRAAEMEAMAAAMKKAGVAAKTAGESFLVANKKKEGVKTTASGLQYKIVKAGTGKKPVATDMVKVNYRGTLIDGTEFDASELHGGPATMPANEVIQGWQEALQLMPVGSKWQLFIPASLAYKDESRGELIVPNSVLVFDIELLSIEKPNGLQGSFPKGKPTQDEEEEEVDIQPAPKPKGKK